MLALTARGAAGDAAFVVATIAAILVVGRVARIVITAVIRRLASRSLLGAYSAWRVRVPRLLAESIPVAELRRQHRVNAAAAMVTRLFKVLLWVIGIVVVLERLEVDLVIAVSGAGFLGAAVAIGGQNSVHDYLNGLHVLLEDRFGEGDSVRATLDGGEVIEGVVSRLGAFASRIETEDGTFHLANRRAHQVLNLSQHAYPRMFDVRVSHPMSDKEALHAITSVIGTASAEALGLGDLGIVVDHVGVVEGRRGAVLLRVAARFARPVTDDAVARLAAAVSDALATR